MAYEEVEIEDMSWDEDILAYTYECPCGDLFQITLEELKVGEEIGHCPSCSLYIIVKYDPEDFAESSDTEREASETVQPPPIAA
ncbi:hypothetical protein CYMTET_30623 [Cymbomonas tetramitiformis]|uniref:Diphthamide biosynthesis protein 3 n=1 Tax=Cymbomonas tetramitiformis TaxID=36881 RepID=A0AAE0KTQ6_9CHLO|nr:hypothetical protein CYMTET_30623 [Cymbomonas tetramitiformis]